MSTEAIHKAITWECAFVLFLGVFAIIWFLNGISFIILRYAFHYDAFLICAYIAVGMGIVLIPIIWFDSKWERKQKQ